MKKMAVLALAVLVLLGAAGCGNNKKAGMPLAEIQNKFSLIFKDDVFSENFAEAPNVKTLITFSSSAGMTAEQRKYITSSYPGNFKNKDKSEEMIGMSKFTTIEFINKTGKSFFGSACKELTEADFSSEIPKEIKSDTVFYDKKLKMVVMPWYEGTTDGYRMKFEKTTEKDGNYTIEYTKIKVKGDDETYLKGQKDKLPELDLVDVIPYNNAAVDLLIKRNGEGVATKGKAVIKKEGLVLISNEKWA